MKITAARVSRSKPGDVSAQEVLDRYITAFGGTLKPIAGIGGELDA